MPPPDAIQEYLDLLVRQVDELEQLAVSASGGTEPDRSVAVSARHRAAELGKKVAQLRAWMARQTPAPRHRKGERKRLLALAMIAEGRSSTEVARAIGVHRTTVNDWRNDPAFAEALRELQDEQMDAVHAQLVAASLDMARCLIAMATGPDTVDNARVQAARVAFELLGRYKESPVAPSAKEGEAETEEDVLGLLDQIPAGLLERSLASRKPKERDL